MQQSIDRLAEICATRDAEHLRRFIKRHINMFGAYNRVALLAATISAAGTMRQAQQELAQQAVKAADAAAASVRLEDFTRAALDEVEASHGSG